LARARHGSMAPWRPASAASPYRHAVSPARSHVSTESSDPYRLSESATRTSNDAYGDYHEIEKIMRRERQENDRMQAQKAELKEAERRAFVAERRAEAAERAAAERAREAEAEVAVAEEVATQAVVANRDARRALEAARAEVEGYRQTLSEMGTPPASPLSARSLRASPPASPHRPDDAAIPNQPASPVQPAKIAELVNALAQADAKAERHRVIADGLRVDLDAAAAALDVERGARLAAETQLAAHEQKRMDAIERLLRRAKDGAALRSDVATPTRASRDLIAGTLTPNDSHDVASAAAAAPAPALTRAEEDLVALEREHAIELDHLRKQLMKSKAETDATRRALDAARAAEEAAVLERDAAAMAGAVAERDLALLERGRVGREGRRALRRVLEELDAIERRSAGIYKVAASAIDLNRRMCEAIEAMPVRSGRWLGNGSSDDDEDANEGDPVGFAAVDEGVERTWRVGRDVLQEAWHHTRGEMRTLRREARTLGAQLERAALAEVRAVATASMYRSHDSRLSSDFDKGFAVGNRLAAIEVNRRDGRSGPDSARSSWESRTFAPATTKTRSRPETAARRSNEVRTSEEVRRSAEVRNSVSRDRLHSRASSARSSAATSIALESHRRGRTTTTTHRPGSSRTAARSPSASPARMGSVRSSAVGSIASAGFQSQSPSSSFGGAGATRRSRSVPRGAGAMSSSADRSGRSAKRRVFPESPGRSVGRARSASAGRTVPIASPVAAYIRGEAPADARPEPRRRGLTAGDYSDASRSKSPGSGKERLKNVILRRGPAGEPRPRDGKTPSQRLAEIQAQRRIPAPSKGKTGRVATSARPSSAPGTRDSSESRFAKSPARSPAKYLRKGGAYEVASRYKSPKGKVDLMPAHRHRSPRKPQGRYAL